VTADAAADGAIDASRDVSPAPTRCTPREVPCADRSIDQLRLLTEPSTGEITQDGELWVIDASAGGRMPTESYVYARFTDRGLERVSIHDEEALSSMEWDIAFRRSVIRLNSGVSGPSCGAGTETPEGTTFESITRVPADAAFRRESYFTPLNCYYVTDGQGIGGPGTLLAGFWRFANNCLQMTNEVYLVRLRDDRVVKLQVRGYYHPDEQRACDEGRGVSMTDNGAATIRVRWSFVSR
jgi:hypothetical protein